MWWILALGAVWPVWAAIRTFLWHPAFSNDVGDVTAALTFGLAVTLTLRAAPIPNLRDWRRKKDIAGLRIDLDALRRQLDEHEVMAAGEIAETRDRLDDLAAGTARAFGAVGKKIPQGVSPDGPTQPIYLSDRRRAV